MTACSCGGTAVCGQYIEESPGFHSKVPSIFLVGRDGKLIASGISIEDLEDVIKKNIEVRRWGGGEKVPR
jgi:hypothetical protein